MSPAFTFYVGTNNPSWLWLKPNRHPLFVSVRRINSYKRLRPANISWCLDSGGFTELTLFDGWKTTPAEYVDSLARIANDIGRTVWASPQDWMCEPHMVKKTGKTVTEHQHLTCENFVTLQDMKPAIRVIPVLQGWQPEDYPKHFDMYRTYGVKLENYETVGLGSFCRRANVQGVRELVWDLYHRGVKMHGFGLKRDGLTLFRDALQSSDSMAWSFTGRAKGWSGKYLCGKQTHKAKTCADCHDWAMLWADNVSKTKQQGQMTIWEMAGV